MRGQGQGAAKWQIEPVEETEAQARPEGERSGFKSFPSFQGTDRSGGPVGFFGSSLFRVHMNNGQPRAVSNGLSFVLMKLRAAIPNARSGLPPHAGQGTSPPAPPTSPGETTIGLSCHPDPNHWGWGIEMPLQSRRDGGERKLAQKWQNYRANWRVTELSMEISGPMGGMEAVYRGGAFP